jgi:hypothetical protein
MEGKFKLTSIVKVLIILVWGAMLLISARTVYSDGASVQFKICPESATEISDLDQTSLIYMVESDQVARVGDHPPGRLPVREMLKQPGVSFVKEDRLPLGPAEILMVEASIGEDFPGQRFMLFPGDNEFLVCPTRRQ